MMKYLPHILLVLSAVIIAWYFDQIPIFGYQKRYSEKQIVNALLKKEYEVLAKECIPNTETCFLIVDSYFLENGRLTTKRDLLLADNTAFSLTGVEVESIKPISWENDKSRYWPVNKLVINSRYAKLSVACGFVMNALDYDHNVKNRVLIGGLGGGVMSNFFSEIAYLNIHTTVVEQEEFIIDIAERYFDHVENSDIKTIHGKFEDYLAKAEKNVFDVVVVDTCTHEKADVICPSSEVLEAKVIQNMARVMTKNAILVVNIHTTGKQVAKEKNIFAKFSKVFNSCFFLKYMEDKKVLICSKKEDYTWNANKQKFMENVATIDEMFEFHLSKFLE